MNHELLPAIDSSSLNAELSRFAGKVIVAATLDLVILMYVFGWFWFGIYLST